MKLHDLRPAPGSNTKKTRVGRGIAAGKGKTAGRGTKGQKARAGGNIPARFEGGQTPLHVRIPKLRGFRNPFKVDYEIVNVGGIARLIEMGVLEAGDMPGATKSKAAPAPITVNQEILRAAGLVRSLNKPMKVLGSGELPVAIFLVADAVSASARTKIEAAGGTVSLLEVPSRPMAALGLTDEADHAPAGTEASEPVDAKPEPKARSRKPAAAATVPDDAPVAEAPADAAVLDEGPAAPAAEAAPDAAEAAIDDDLTSDATDA
ncbi:MAG: 50S ribosomal protein L15 [Chloroflexota bacterium]|nr:MAG: 50S ribosomal protein L15 [Chloroflexota bacterium]